MFEKIKEYYDKGFWDEAKVCAAVIKGVITAAQFTEITGKGFLE